MKKLSKGLCIVLSLIFAFTFGVEAFASQVASGKCGDDLTWSLSPSGTLTISGSGEMYDFLDGSTGGTYYPLPWEDYKRDIYDVVIEEGVTGIGNFAFCECTNLTSIHIPKSLKSIGDFSFQKCDYIVDLHISDLGAWCNIDFSTTASNPLYNSNQIVKKVYLNGESLTRLEIPDGLEEVKEDTFAGWSNLISVNVPDSVKTIGDCAFRECTSLTNVNIPNSVTDIGKFAFYECSLLMNIIIPDSVTKIGEYAFSNCSNLMNVELSENILSIEAFTFSNCPKLRSIELPSHVTSIGEYAFSNCYSLISAEIPDSVTSIKDNAFEFCGLSNITLGNGLKTIGASAFSNCADLISVEIPESVLRVGEWAFYKCSALERITFDSKSTMLPDSPYAISDSAMIFGYEGSVAQTYAQKFNRIFVMLRTENYECTFGEWQTFGWQSHIRYCTDVGCEAFEKQAHVYTSETDLTCEICGYGESKCPVIPEETGIKGDLNGDGEVNNADAIYLLYHVIFGGTLYPLN